VDYNLPMLAAETVSKLLPKSLFDRLHPRALSLLSKSQRKQGRGVRFVDINVVDHCNLNCKYCANFCPLAPESFLDPAAYDSVLERFAVLTGGKVGTIRLLGGEPLLHPALNEIMAITRRRFPGSRIDLVTNGLLLLKMPGTFWSGTPGSCRECGAVVAISHYPIALNYPKIRETARRHGVKTLYGRKSRGMYKWVLDPGGGQDAFRSHAHCFRASQCAVLDISPARRGRLYACSVPPWIKYFNAYFKKDLSVSKDDYLDIDRARSLDEILAFLAKPVPFCRYCDTTANTYRHKWEVSSKDISEWTGCGPTAHWF